MMNNTRYSKLKTQLLFWAILFGGNLTSYSLGVPANNGKYIVDKAGILDQMELRQTNHILKKFEENGNGAQMAVLILSSLKGEPLEQYSLRVAEAWKLGHKGSDKGALLLISMQDKKTRIEIGDGLEGAIPDGRAGDILRGLSDYMRGSQYQDGIAYVVSEIFQSATGKQLGNSVVAPHVKRSSSRRLPSAVFFFIIIGIIIRLILSGGGRGSGGILSIGTYGGSGSSGGFSSGGGSFSGGGGGFSGGGGGFSGGGASGGW